MLRRAAGAHRHPKAHDSTLHLSDADTHDDSITTTEALLLLQQDAHLPHPSTTKSLIRRFIYLLFRRIPRYVVVVVLLISLIVLQYSPLSQQRLVQLAENVFLRPLFPVYIKSDVIHDKLDSGKYCQAVHGVWKCYDCGDSEDETSTKRRRRRRSNNKLSITNNNTLSSSLSPRRPHCHRISPKGTCAPFLIQYRDTPARFSSQYNGLDPSTLATRTLGLRPRFFYEQQPLCHPMSECWDMTRCIDELTLTVYTNETTASSSSRYLLDYAIQAIQSNKHSKFRLRRVDHYKDACLVLVTNRTYLSAQALKASEHWKVDGTNNILWHVSYFQLDQTKTIDLPFVTTWHAEKAALMSATLERAYYRPGFDMALPLPRDWGRIEPPEQVDIHRPRKWLLGFRGKVQATPHPYYQYRWLAAEYWEDAEDVIVDVKCQREVLVTGNKVVEKDYENKVSYRDILWNSTFGFAPGGSGVGSFRFGEILSTGGIPVITPDYVTPFSPEIDWSKCVIVVSEARIINLPHVLRKVTSSEIRNRQRECWKLMKLTLGDAQHGMFAGATKKSENWYDDERVTFTLAMEIWAARIANTIAMQKRMKSIIINS